MKNICLVGIGPHSKRIYLNYIKSHHLKLPFIIDLKSKENDIRNYLDSNGFKETKILLLDDKYKDNQQLPKRFKDNLICLCSIFKIDYIIIATEPKGHNMYLRFAIENNINVVTDKPITARKNMNTLSSVKKVREDYYYLLNMSKKSKSKVYVMCQRQYHKGYEYVKEVLSNIVKKYNIPITYIEIYHCDGAFEMPHDMLKENHPYKYGYGKLLHSGYHFIDLLSDFIKINNDNLKGSKRIVKASSVSNAFYPNDELEVFNREDYINIFKNQIIPELYNKRIEKFNNFGEKNYYSMFEFKNKNNSVITNANLNLLHYGFSRRGWIQTKDFYKSNGRIRHEHINIQVGPLLNIQIHSYQSKEIRDSKSLIDEIDSGGLEHFDIDIYRNTDIIGGKPFERIRLYDLYNNSDKEQLLGNNKLGFNEKSREDFLNNVFNNKCNKGTLEDQQLSIEILYSLLKENVRSLKGKRHTIYLNRNCFPITLKKLQLYSHEVNKNIMKEVIKYKEYYKDDYYYISYINKVKNHYEVYLTIRYNNKVVSSLFYKKYNNIYLANLYYIYISLIAKTKNLQFIYYKLNKKETKIIQN